MAGRNGERGRRVVGRKRGREGKGNTGTEGVTGRRGNVG